ncbi:MAG: hypothetical protein AAB550_01325 [Patescibacteria group bacterium]
MATLGEVGYYSRRIVKWGIISVIIIMLIPFVFRIIKSIYLTLLPPAPPAPTVSYGKLPLLNFELANSAYKPQLRLETIEGKLPGLSNVGQVYFVETSRSRILSLDKVKLKARYLGFDREPEALDERTYKFTHPKDPSVLTVDIISDKLQFRYDWVTNQELYTKTLTLPREQVVSEAKSFLQSLNLLPADIAESQIKITYLTATPPTLTPAISASEANFARADFYRSDKDGLKFVAPGIESAPISIVLGSKIILADYNYSKTIDGDFATYPLRGVQAAWDELVGGGGYIAKPAANNVAVRKVSLAYFESNLPQRFLQPVYVFEGDGGFTAFVQAISPDYVDPRSAK